MLSVSILRKFGELIKKPLFTDLSTTCLQKTYIKFPTRKQIPLSNDIQDYYFQFYCHENSLTFDDKLAYFQAIIDLRPDQKHNQIIGLKNIIGSLRADIYNSSYLDQDEFNVSYYINLLHKVQLYDDTTWIQALDNYHKQGTLNWIDFKELHNSIKEFSQSIAEEWQRNVINDISQEAWNDFMGFLRNCQKLQLEAEEFNEIYQMMRKQKIRASNRDIAEIIQYFKQQTQNIQAFKMIFTFLLDNGQDENLEFLIKKSLEIIFREMYQKFDGFKEINIFVEDFDSYLKLLKILQLGVEIDNEQELLDQLFEVYHKNMLKQKSNEQIIEINEMTDFMSNQSIFTKEQENAIKEKLVQDGFKLVEQVKTRKQDLLGLIIFFEQLPEQQLKQQFLCLIARSRIQISDLNNDLKQVIQVFNMLDENDLAYYLIDFLDSSIQYINANIDNLQPEDWCLCYYILYKYVAKDHQEFDTYDQKLNTLKQYIRLHYMVRYQGKIPLESSFYKILQIVQLETFLVDDLLNYY